MGRKAGDVMPGLSHRVIRRGNRRGMMTSARSPEKWIIRPNIALSSSSAVSPSAITRVPITQKMLGTPVMELAASSG